MITPDIAGVTILDELGRGGFSIVYRAEQTGFSRVVAAKVLSLDPTDAALVDTFMAEARNIGELAARPDVVTVYETGLDSVGRPYLLLQYLPGGSLGDRLKSQGPLAVPEVLEVGTTVAGVLVAAHDHGILHCDLKPANVLFDANGRPVLADFGIARATAAADSSRSMAFLTPDHAAPELWEGRPPSVSTDLYALGSMLHQLLVGRAPFQDPTGKRLPPLQVMRRVLADPAPPIVRPDVPPQLAQLVQRLLSKDPADRPASATVVFDDIRSIAFQSDVGAGPDGTDAADGRLGLMNPDGDRTRRRTRPDESIPTIEPADAATMSGEGARLVTPLGSAASAGPSARLRDPVPSAVSDPSAVPTGFDSGDALPERRTRLSPSVVAAAAVLLVAAGIGLFVLMSRSGGDRERSDGTVTKPTASTTTTSTIIDEPAPVLRLGSDVQRDGGTRILTGTIDGNEPWYVTVKVLAEDGNSTELGYAAATRTSVNRIQGVGPEVELYLSEMTSPDGEVPLPTVRLCFRTMPDDPAVGITTVCDPAS